MSERVVPLSATVLFKRKAARSAKRSVISLVSFSSPSAASRAMHAFTKLEAGSGSDAPNQTPTRKRSVVTLYLRCGGSAVNAPINAAAAFKRSALSEALAPNCFR
jgi:hypothetical protein